MVFYPVIIVIANLNNRVKTYGRALGTLKKLEIRNFDFKSRL